MSIMLFIASCELILTCFLGPCRESDVAKLHPPPLNALAADESLRDEQYADSIYAKHYLALIQVGEDQFALVWASKKNLSKLGSHTKLIMCDGTFKTAPCFSDNSHFYQVLILHAKYRTSHL